MNHRQLKLYRAEWAKARAVLRSQGKATRPETEEAERMRIHTEVVGMPCSSKELTNEQLDQVLAAFYLISAQLDKYLDAKAQPETRCRYLVDDILDRISSLYIAAKRPKEAIERGPGRDGYILYLARRFAKKPLHGGLAEIDLRTWYKIIACLRIRLDQVQRKLATSANEGRGAKRSRPYDAPAHDSGRRNTTPRPARNVAVN